MLPVPGDANELTPAWIHSSLPSGPWPTPPTPTQAATWPLATVGASSEVTIAAAPNALVRDSHPAYAYGTTPQAAVSARVEAGKTSAAGTARSAAQRAGMTRRGFTMSSRAGPPACLAHRQEHRVSDPSTEGSSAVPGLDQPIG